MFSFSTFTLTFTIISSLFISSVLGQSDLKVLKPTADLWWVAQSVNTLAWSGNTPQSFSVFLNNADEKILTSKLALVSVEPIYEYSKDVNPGNVTPGTGYTIQLTDILNSSNIWAESDKFEIKAVGSTYPPQTTSAVPSGSSSPSGSQSSGSTTPSGSQSATSNAGDHTLVPTGLIGGILVLCVVLVF
ncbi:hypothetical protein M231_06720 [Tremella mesenterica]|uniref:Uncharacterized protein n=1 Tax=Tremella mesenterica TaxID=5217 RepID=A0A4Q1BDG2_TREME|nr:uncharacterized protein TREMEDRAFT_60832 [Tremella mesenterica DSM 1558]EIW70342.1 hypothetical protein TREMEDRAFT_60832 [Tremella mesenterica DSM 1558]RXK36006.1 hypothetical protein M231_06720 [Tremella mesenterica]